MGVATLHKLRVILDYVTKEGVIFDLNGGPLPRGLKPRVLRKWELCLREVKDAFVWDGLSSKKSRPWDGVGRRLSLPPQHCKICNRNLYIRLFLMTKVVLMSK